MNLRREYIEVLRERWVEGRLGIIQMIIPGALYNWRQLEKIDSALLLRKWKAQVWESESLCGKEKPHLPLLAFFSLLR